MNADSLGLFLHADRVDAGNLRAFEQLFHSLGNFCLGRTLGHFKGVALGGDILPWNLR